MRTAVLLVLLATAAAEARPKTLTMKREEASNLHMAGNRGANNRRLSLTITIVLGAKGKLAVTAVGKDGDHWLNGGTGENTDVDTSWTTTWSGTWKERATELVLDLALAKDMCTKQQTSDRFAPETLTCDVPSQRAQLVCRSERVDVAAAGSKPRSVDAWRCTTEDGELGETSPNWVVGKTTCIKTQGGRMSRDSFAPC